MGRFFPDAHTVMPSGPAIADEFARGMPTVVVLAGAERFIFALVRDFVE